MSPLRVLLVGSDTAESRHISAVLEQVDHAVVPVPSFEDASEALLIQKFDAVLITAAFSGNVVSNFAANLREQEKNQRSGARTPVLSVLAASANTTAPSANGSVDAFLLEPFEPLAFAETVESLANAVAQSNQSTGASLAAPELPVFDLAGFEEQVAYDRELMVEIIDLFLAERDHDLTEMTESLAAGDLEQLMRSAHTIKGSLGSLHANLARYRSQELEIAAKARNHQACISLLGALEQDLKDLEPRLLSLRASAQDG